MLPLDDLLAITCEFLCKDVSRSGLDRCLRRHGVSNIKALTPATPKGSDLGCTTVRRTNSATRSSVCSGASRASAEYSHCSILMPGLGII